MSQSFTALKKLFHLSGKIVHRVRHHGLMNILLWSVYQVSWRLRERRLGIVTGEFSHKFRQRDDGECVAYEPISYKCFDLIMEKLPDLSAVRTTRKNPRAKKECSLKDLPGT